MTISIPRYWQLGLAGAAATLAVAFVPTISSAQFFQEGCQGSIPTIIGTPGDDVLVGTSGNDIIYGMGGNDIIKGRGGNDSLCGGEGNDKIYGQRGNDIISGGSGDDQIFGAVGDDVLMGGPGNDTIRGGGGKDTLHGDAGNDTLFGGHNSDRLAGMNGDDVLRGGRGADAIAGGIGNDLARGGAGRDVCEKNDGENVRCESVEQVAYTEATVQLDYVGNQDNPDFSTGGVTVSLEPQVTIYEPGVPILPPPTSGATLASIPVAEYDVTGTQFTVTLPLAQSNIAYQNAKLGEDLGDIMGSTLLDEVQTGLVTIPVTDVLYTQ